MGMDATQLDPLRSAKADTGSLRMMDQHGTPGGKAPETSFDEAYRQHHAGVGRYVFSFVNDTAIADEIAQDVFVRAYRAWETFRGEAAVKTWLFSIARNAAIDYLRSPRSRDRADGTIAAVGDSDLPPESAFVMRAPDLDADVAEAAQRTEMTSCVRRFIAEMPETLRTPLVLHDIEGFTNAEIAELLECSLSAAKMRLHRARKQLQGLVSERCDLFRDERDVLSCLPGPADRPAIAPTAEAPRYEYRGVGEK